MTTQAQNNAATLIGCLVTNDENSEFLFSHEVNGEKFYSFTLEVERISNTKDCIPIIVSERLIDKNHTYADMPLCVEGQFRSYNKKSETKVHQILYFFAQHIYPIDEPHMNEICINGFVCKEPIYRTTPFGREITDLMLAVPRLCGKTDYIPCICWGRNAIFASSFPVGTQVQIAGRIQSREYTKIIDNIAEIRTAYEISANQICCGE